MLETNLLQRFASTQEFKDLMPVQPPPPARNRHSRRRGERVMGGGALGNRSPNDQEQVEHMPDLTLSDVESQLGLAPTR